MKRSPQKFIYLFLSPSSQLSWRIIDERISLARNMLSFINPTVSSIQSQIIFGLFFPSHNRKIFERNLFDRGESLCKCFPRLFMLGLRTSLSRRFTSATMSPSYTVRQTGQKYTKAFKVYCEQNGEVVSFFHDVPLFPTKTQDLVNMIVEIPRWSNAKLEISKEEPLNPIRQDEKKGKLRFVANCFPYKGYLWNYGALPQTWEDPQHRFHSKEEAIEAHGDNDPLDVVEIGSRIFHVGEIRQVKPLGIMALLDEGEVDWKIIAIDSQDPLFDKLNDIEDVRTVMPGLIEATRRWFEIYKIPDGKPPNRFLMEGRALDKAYALNIIHGTHDHWKNLIHGMSEKGTIACFNRTIKGSPHGIDPSDERIRAIPPNEQIPAVELDSEGEFLYFS
jgi:inorganic pyrophosphatase